MQKYENRNTKSTQKPASFSAEKKSRAKYGHCIGSFCSVQALHTITVSGFLLGMATNLSVIISLQKNWEKLQNKQFEMVRLHMSSFLPAIERNSV
jgi:hypothetical protein